MRPSWRIERQLGFLIVFVVAHELHNGTAPLYGASAIDKPDSSNTHDVPSRKIVRPPCYTQEPMLISGIPIRFDLPDSITLAGVAQGSNDALALTSRRLRGNRSEFLIRLEHPAAAPTETGIDCVTFARLVTDTDSSSAPTSFSCWAYFLGMDGDLARFDGTRKHLGTWNTENDRPNDPRDQASYEYGKLHSSREIVTGILKHYGTPKNDPQGKVDLWVDTSMGERRFLVEPRTEVIFGHGVQARGIDKSLVVGSALRFTVFDCDMLDVNDKPVPCVEEIELDCDHVVP